MKHTANLITAGRIIGALILLLIEPLSVPFFVIYALCVISDILDGYIARRMKTAGRFGAVLDSIADVIFVAAMLIVFIPIFDPDLWLLYWMGGIALIRFFSLAVGYAKYHALSFLHTYANKATGAALACFPVLHLFFSLSATAAVLCGIASLSALEELIITIYAKSLNRNTTTIFRGRRKKPAPPN